MTERKVPSALVASGLTELAVSALSGWLYSLVIADKERARALGIVSGPRVRQWHLDLAALGTATVAMGAAVPDAPRPLQTVLAAGAWSNAMMFLPLAFRPEWADDPRYRAVAVGSFVTTSVGFVGYATMALSRRRATRR
ncbi:hypothetical protein [Nocardioides daejeonensis]|uniref:hypothetical protein n=1 Tax=Nocardioides daejeonensis TaxID=1046556 RepID=UPI00194DB268|nr:hypothetical protein [Nocardioides daejeonensis]